MASQELIPFSDEENRELGLGPYAATATPEGGAIAAGGIIPFTGTELVEAVEGDPSRQLGYEEFERYRRAKSVEPEKTFDEKLGIVGQGLEMVGEEFFGGIWSAVSQGLYLTDPLKGIKTLVSGSARGGTDMFHIIGDIFTKDFHAADTYEKYLEDTGSEDDQDSRQDYIRQLSKDKMRFNLKRAYEVEREKWRTGETKTTLPFIGEIEGEDVAGAEAFGYVGDFTMAIPAAGAFTKLPAVAARAAGRVGGLAGKAVGGTGRGVTKVTDAIGEKVGKVIPEASQTTARVLGIAGSTVSGQPAIGLALAAPTIGRSLDVAGRLGEKVGESLGKRPSQFGVLERVAMDSTVDPNLRKLARILHMGGAGDKLLSGTGTLALGVGTGMVVGGGLGYLAQGEEGMLQGLGAGIGIGGPASLAGAGLSKLTGHARRSAEDADVMRFLEAQAKKGVDPKQALAKLGRDALLKTATLERIFQGDVAVNLLTDAQYNKAHKAGAAAWSPERKSIDINIEASDVKGRRQNILHEFGHALWDSPVVNKSEMTAELVGVYGQTRIDAMATNYVERLAENRVRRRFKNPFSKAADDAVQRWKEGKPPKGVDDFDVAVNAERADLTKQFGLDWVHSEIFAEDFVGSTLDRNLNKLRKGKTGEDLFHLRGAMLRTKAAIQRKMGGKLDPLGRVDGAYASRIFGDMTGDKKFKKTLRNYIRDRGRHFDEMGRRAKNPDGGGTKQDILNMGDRAGFWRDKGDGTFENDFATKNAKGEVTVKGHDEIAKTLHDRAEGTRRLRDGLVAKGLIGRDDKSTLGAREGADGSIEVTGKAIPDEVIEASNLPPQMKEHLKLLNELVGNGTTAMVWYNGISTTKSKKIKMNEVVKTTKDGTPDLRGTTRMWRRNLRKFMGNIAASRRDIKPFEYRITKEGNITVQSLDVDAIHDKVSRWQRDTDANGRPKLELWGNDVKRFYEDLKIYMDNHRKGLGGAEGIGEAKRNGFRAFLMRDMTGSGGVSPMHDILNNRPVDRTSIVKSFRLDRIGSVESTMREDFHFDYHKVKENLMPDGTPKVKEHGEVIEFNEAMAERFMPVAPEGARYMDFRDMQGEKMIGLSIDRLGHGVRTLASGASSEIAAQGGRAFMWLEGKWASYKADVFEKLINQMKMVGTEYLALSVLGDLNHNNTRYGMRLFGESIRDAVTRGDITNKQANSYIELMTSNAANIAGMKSKSRQSERNVLRELTSVQQFIDAVDAGDLTHIAGEVLTGQRKTKGAKFNFSREEAEQLQFGPRSTARMAVDGGLWDEKKFPLGTVVAVMKIKHNMGSPKYDAANDIPIVHEPNLHYHYGFTVDVEPVAYAKTFYPLSSLSRGKSRAVDKQGKPTGGNVFEKDGSVGPQPLQSIMPELDLLTEGKMGPPIDHPVNYMPATVDSMNMHSRVEQVTLGDKVPNKGGGDQMLSTIKKQLGVKQDELDWLGLEEFLKGKKSVTKDEVLGYIREHDIQLEEVVHGGNILKNRVKYGFGRNAQGMDEAGNLIEPKFEEWTLDGHVGGSNREVLFVLPDRSKHLSEFERKELEGMGVVPDEKNLYESPHWSRKNVLAHLRFNERTGPNGEKILFIEEIQSDWHREGRKYGYGKKRGLDQAAEELDHLLKLDAERKGQKIGSWEPLNPSEAQQFLLEIGHREYLTPRIGEENYARLREMAKRDKNTPPDAPFKTSWHELVLKRVLGLAAHGKFDKVAWINGEETVKRYDLRKHIDSISYHKNTWGTYEAQAYRDTQRVAGVTDAKADAVEKVFGKEITDKIINDAGVNGELSGGDLKMGGDWALNLYDRMVPQFLKKYGKKFGAKVGRELIDRGGFKVNKDHHAEGVGRLAYRLEASNSPTVISRHATAGEAWKEAERLGQSLFQSIDVTPKMAESHARFMPEDYKGSTDPVMGQARRDNVTGKDWDDIVDQRKPVTLSPIPTKRDLLIDQGVSLAEAKELEKNFKKGMNPIKASLQLLNTKQAEKVGATRETPEGTRVGVRQDIPFRRRLRAWHKAGMVDRISSAWAIHDPRNPKGSPMAYDTIVRLKNVQMFINKGTVGASNDIEGVAAGWTGKFPMAQMDGDLIQVYSKGKLKRDAMPKPEELGDTGKWVEIGMDPHRHEYFYRKDNHRIPIESASEAILVGDTAFVRADDALVQGDRSQSRYFPAETARMESDYMDAVAKGDVDTMQAAVDQAAKLAGYDIGPVYHGSDAEFNKFDMEKASPASQGLVFFSDDPEFATYGKNVKRYFLKGNVREGRLDRREVDGRYVFDDGKFADETVTIDDATHAVGSPNQIKSADPATFDDNGNVIPLHDRFNLESDDVRHMPEPAVTSQDGSVRTVPTKGRIVRTGKSKFRVYNLSGKLMGVAATQAAADALLNRGRK